MEYWCWVALWVEVIGFGQAPPAPFGRHQLERIQRGLHGQLLDFTHNHGADRRIWSPALGERRDVYVYLPPGYDPARKYPMTITLHGAAQDELFYIQSQVQLFDRAIANGLVPPFILVVPDGSLRGHATAIKPASFWTNSKAGAFEDYVMCDVWNFITCNFSVRPEREAHTLTGASMGGSAAFALAIKHKDRVKTAVGFAPLLNLRYVDCHGKYRTNFDPCCFGLRERMNGYEALGRRRLFTLRFDSLFGPLFGRGDEAIAGLSAINPYELMDRYDLQPGELNLYAAYGGRDEFNVGAQIESFVWRARQRGIEVTVDCDPNGGHDLSTALKLFPAAVRWTAERSVGSP